MEWEEFRKLIFSISHREENKLICKKDKEAEAILMAIHKISREGIVFK